MNIETFKNLEKDWELVSPGLGRTPVPGGWLYGLVNSNRIVYVPKPSSVFKAEVQCGSCGAHMTQTDSENDTRWYECEACDNVKVFVTQKHFTEPLEGGVQ